MCSTFLKVNENTALKIGNEGEGEMGRLVTQTKSHVKNLCEIMDCDLNIKSKIKSFRSFEEQRSFKQSSLRVNIYWFYVKVKDN